MKGEIIYLEPQPAEMKQLRPGDLFLLQGQSMIKQAINEPSPEPGEPATWGVVAVDVGSMGRYTSANPLAAEPPTVGEKTARKLWDARELLLGFLDEQGGRGVELADAIDHIGAALARLGADCYSPLLETEEKES